ncbi:type VII secretion protein EccB [Mycolicibacterium sp. CBM1]
MRPTQERRAFASRTPSNDNSDGLGYRRGFITRHQVTGWRFVLRRIASGIALHDTRMLVDPLRSQSRAVTMGGLIVITGLVGCFVFSVLRPNGTAGSNPILADRDTSALYVRVDDRLHPVLNLISARLITGRPATPKVVNSSALDTLPRGPVVGIPGAPERMVQNTSRDAEWTVCDRLDGMYSGTTVIGGPLVQGGARASALPRDKAVLVAGGSPDAPTTWLLWDGRRSRIDLSDRAVTDALGLPVPLPAPRPVALGLFNAIPESAPLVAPAIPGAGTMPLFPMSVLVPVGSVVSALGIDDTLFYYAVLPDGLQPISAVLAALLRNSNSYGLAQPPRLAADEIAHLPVSRVLAAATYPDQPISLTDTMSAPVTCVQWSQRAGAPSSSLTIMTGAVLPIADSAHPVELAAAESSLTATRVVLPIGTGYFVQTVAQQPPSPPAGALFWVSDTGVRYGIEAANSDELAATVAALGLTMPATAAPWSVLALLAPGPALSSGAALLVFTGTEKR